MSKTISLNGKIVGVEAEAQGIVFYSSINDVKSTQSDTQPHQEVETKKIHRGPITKAFTIKLEYEPVGKVYFTVSFNEKNQLVELFINISRPSPEIATSMGSIARLVSLSLKHGATPQEIAKHLQDQDSGQYVPTKFPGQKKGKIVKSLPALIGHALLLYGDWNRISKIAQQLSLVSEPTSSIDSTDSFNVNAKSKSTDVTTPSNIVIHPCPVCGAELIRAEGCWSCPSCGYAKCE